jgi:ABC-type uncharacterized transport system substrate-binding protein
MQDYSSGQHTKELVALQPDLLLSQSTPATTALLQETRTIPVIFGIVADPIGSGFVASFNRPGGNAAGFTAKRSMTVALQSYPNANVGPNNGRRRVPGHGS